MGHMYLLLIKFNSVVFSLMGPVLGDLKKTKKKPKNFLKILSLHCPCVLATAVTGTGAGSYYRGKCCWETTHTS